MQSMPGAAFSPMWQGSPEEHNYIVRISTQNICLVRVFTTKCRGIAACLLNRVCPLGLKMPSVRALCACLLCARKIRRQSFSLSFHHRATGASILPGPTALCRMSLRWPARRHFLFFSPPPRRRRPFFLGLFLRLRDEGVRARHNRLFHKLLNDGYTYCYS